MSDRRDPSLGHTVPAGWAVCTKVDMTRPADPPCGRPARWHVLWHVANGSATSLSCHEHYFRECQRVDKGDDHEFGGACGVPGSVWVLARDGRPSHCVIPLEDDEDIVQSVETREPVGASS